jgi:uncharacterized protein
MCSLAGVVVEALVQEYGSEEFLRRISDPNWFQAFACALGFDWHSSGTTTVTTAALKESLTPDIHGIAVAGGKGKTSSKAPGEIRRLGDSMSLSTRKVDDLVYASRISAKVDSSLVQDGYSIYHHAFFFTSEGKWAVVQQGMNGSYARRYHWLSDLVQSFIEEPHSAISADRQESSVLDLTSKESDENRKAALDLVRDGPHRLLMPQRTLSNFCQLGAPELSMPRRHQLLPSLDIGIEGMKALQAAYELQPSSYEELIALKGIGPKRVRALSLISELIYGASPSWKDPARYSYAHGGKDGTPYPVDRDTYDRTIMTLREAIEEAKFDRDEKLEALRRLSRCMKEVAPA